MAQVSTDNNTDAGGFSSEADESIDTEFIVVGNKCRTNKSLQAALDTFPVPKQFSNTGFEFMTDADYDTIFIVDKFDGDVYHRLHKSGCRIMGPSVIIRCANTGERLPNNKRPIYCTFMKKLVLCFTGFKIKDELSHLADLIHHMGGSVRRDLNASVTHLIANCTSGEKYRTAVSLETAIMNKDWVYNAWEQRDDTIFKTEETTSQYKLSPFSFTILSFYGFSKEESRHMEDVAVENGGLCAEAGAPNCTHLVVDEHSSKQINFSTMPKLHIVKSEWFWASIQVEARADENFYRFEVPTDTPENVLCSKKTTPGSKTRKRKRDLKERMAQLASEGEVDTPMYKRRSSEMARLSFSGSFLDATVDTSAGTPLSAAVDYGQKENQATSSPSTVPGAPPKEPAVKLSARNERTMELFHTEKNYVGILHTILKVFKECIERPDQAGGPILGVQEIKTIFGGIPPIYDVHVKIRDSLCEIAGDWKEEALVGNVILNHAEELAKAYPNFVNYFEQAKETIQQCDTTKRRFHAFLKVCQSKPECGRQSLTELLIRPVQRLPSMMLLLKDMLKKTDPTNPDFPNLEQAINRLDEVTKHINEDRRKAEGHQAMFDIVNDIENCPPSLLSAHRHFINKVDCIEMTDGLSGKGDCVTLFIFSDSLELCKRRTKVLSSRSPATVLVAKTPQKAYRHLDVLSFSSIKRVVNIAENSGSSFFTDCRNIFALITKKSEERAEVMHAFALADELYSKEEFLTALSKSICAHMCRTDYETLLTTVDAHMLHIDPTDIGNRSISRAASKFGKRVSRAFSFNKTPRRLKRAMSSMTQMMSPFRRESGMFTPRGSDLRAMRLASTNDLMSEESPLSSMSRTPSTASMASVMSENFL